MAVAASLNYFGTLPAVTRGGSKPSTGCIAPSVRAAVSRPLLKGCEPLADVLVTGVDGVQALQVGFRLCLLPSAFVSQCPVIAHPVEQFWITLRCLRQCVAESVDCGSEMSQRDERHGTHVQDFDLEVRAVCRA